MLRLLEVAILRASAKRAGGMLWARLEINRRLLSSSPFS